jgi:hypothetical protein
MSSGPIPPALFLATCTTNEGDTIDFRGTSDNPEFAAAVTVPASTAPYFKVSEEFLVQFIPKSVFEPGDYGSAGAGAPKKTSTGS